MKYLEKFRLDKKTAFILGGSGLIGSEIVKATLEAGARVVVLEKNFNKKLNFQKKILNMKNLMFHLRIKLRSNTKKYKKNMAPQIFL